MANAWSSACRFLWANKRCTGESFCRAWWNGTRCGSDYQRCLYGAESFPYRSHQRHTVAVFPDSFAPECQPVCPPPEHETGSGRDIRIIFNAVDRAQTEAPLWRTRKIYGQSASRHVGLLEGNIWNSWPFSHVWKIICTGSAQSKACSESVLKPDDGLRWLESSPMKYLTYCK